MKWKDSRLTFANLITDSENNVTPEKINKLWIPLQYVTHDNALIGKVHPDTHSQVKIQALTSPIPMVSDRSTQDTLYAGAHNLIVSKQRYRLLYKCVFNLRDFPFDTQTCTFVMRMDSDKFSAVALTKDQPSISYVGPKIVKEFKVDEVMTYTGMTEKNTYFNFTITLNRVYTDQLIATFFPTILLWFLAYFTLFIKVDDFNERIMVAVTVLLVLAALLSSIKNQIPSTSYFKYIDLWFLWYTTFIFSITIFHIVLHEICERPVKNKVSVGGKVVKVEAYDVQEVYKGNEKSRKAVINDIAKKLLLVPFLLFNLIYLLVQFYLK